MSDLVGNPEDRFSRVAAQLLNGVITAPVLGNSVNEETRTHLQSVI